MNSQEIVEKLTTSFEKVSKEFIEDIISIFEGGTTESLYLEEITKEPYFTYEEAVGFYHSGTCKDGDEEIPLGLEMTRALHFWGLWGAFRLSGPYEEGDEDISHEEVLLFRRTGIRLCECVLDLFP